MAYGRFAPGGFLYTSARRPAHGGIRAFFEVCNCYGYSAIGTDLPFRRDRTLFCGLGADLSLFLNISSLYDSFI